MSILGNAVPRVEDERFLTVGGSYVGDMDLPGMVHCCFVRSVMAHARIKSIETTDAAACQGVLGVFTADDLDLPDITPMPMLAQGHARPPLARGTVRFVGEPIAVVVAESLALAQDAAEMVFVDFDPLDAVIGVSAARDGTTILHEESGTNLSFVLAPTPGEISFDECEVVVEADIVNQRLAACPSSAAARTAARSALVTATSRSSSRSARARAARVRSGARRTAASASGSPRTTPFASCSRASGPR